MSKIIHLEDHSDLFLSPEKVLRSTLEQVENIDSIALVYKLDNDNIYTAWSSDSNLQHIGLAVILRDSLLRCAREDG